MKTAKITIALLVAITLSMVLSVSYAAEDRTIRRNNDAAERRLALIIGNSAYKSSPLKNPVNDAMSVEKTLKSFGFTVWKHEDLSYQKMMKSVDDFGDELLKGGGVGAVLDGKQVTWKSTSSEGNFYFADSGGSIGTEKLKPPEPTASKPESASDTVRKAKYQLRKEPMTVSDDEFLRVFRLRTDKIEISGKKYPVLRPLEYIHNDFKDNGDDTITAHTTGLMWQKSGSDKTLTYEKAKAYVEKLNRIKFAGYADWRLPTVDELASLLIPKEMNGDLYINLIFDKTQRYCWTSDPRASGGAWVIHFDGGDVVWNDLVDDDYVRAVRSLQ